MRRLNRLSLSPVALPRGGGGSPYGPEQTLTLQPAEAQGVDTYLDGVGSVLGNFGINANIQAGAYSTTHTYFRGLIYFDISTIPAGSLIESATLTLFCTNEQNSTDFNVSLHRALTQWYEGAQNGGAPAGGENGSVWNFRNYNGSVAWAGGAGGAAGSDWEAVATATTPVVYNAANSWDVKADIEAFLAGTNNYGWWIIGSEANNNSYKVFASSTDATASRRPKLEVVYRPPL